MAKKTNGKSPQENGIVTQAVAQAENDLRKLTELCNNDPELAQFFLEWLTNGRNGRKAYKTLHPEVSDRVAAVLGSRKLMKVDILQVLSAYGLDGEKYLRQLKAGLAAKTGGILRKFNKDGTLAQELDLRRPDHKVRRFYHEALGQILGIEGKKEVGGNTFNIIAIFEGINKTRKERGLPTI